MTYHHTHDREVHTSLYCHECDKNFVALLDHRLTGNHLIECPHCGHEHCRVMVGGKVTGERWDSRYGNKLNSHRPRKMWKDNVLPARTNSAGEFISELWLRRLT